MSKVVLEQLPDGRWKVVNTQYHIGLIFVEHHFNDKQEPIVIDGKSKDISAIDAARAMREIGDWMARNHYDIVF